MQKLHKILVANRGEIAVRIIRACRELGISPAVIYSEADRTSLHVRMADEAYLIGPPPATESYLNQEKIIEIAKKCGAEAIHPGYGFLAENGDFAEKVIRAGLIFIGPPPEALKLSGDKLEARQLASRLKIPVISGSSAVADEKEVEQFAKKIGFPILLKAAAGGGGKGMRVVGREKELTEAFRGARHEAKSAFGDERIYLEKFLNCPRHIEVQILADSHGHYRHLGERECSIQRRHQKLIEESPSPAVSPALRQKLGQAAIKMAKSVGYVNAGTVEFLLDEMGKFYFLEINARLQVEHPVTEMVTGLDLVKWQIAIARGERLSFTQAEIRPKGWAIECRIYAEDYRNNFFPSSGRITEYREPSGPGVRVDSGVARGSEVSLYYDPLIAKLIVCGKDRPEAIARMKRALSEYRISGIATTIDFHSWVMGNPRFQAGKLSTNFLTEELDKVARVHEKRSTDVELAALSAVLSEYWQERRGVLRVASNGKKVSNWKMAARQAGLRNWE